MAELLKERMASAASGEASVRRICFVCTGNTCRSPMAEAVANAFLQEEKDRVLKMLPQELRDTVTSTTEAFSRGLYARENEPISQGALHALEKAEIATVQGHDYHMHAAHNLSAEDAASFDLLIGMTTSHTMELMMRFPQAANRIVCMPQQIVDPYGGDDETYRQCLMAIVEGVRTLLGMEHTV